MLAPHMSFGPVPQTWEPPMAPATACQLWPSQWYACSPNAHTSDGPLPQMQTMPLVNELDGMDVSRVQLWPSQCMSRSLKPPAQALFGPAVYTDCTAVVSRPGLRRVHDVPSKWYAESKPTAQTSFAALPQMALNSSMPVPAASVHCAPS